MQVRGLRSGACRRGGPCEHTKPGHPTGGDADWPAGLLLGASLFSVGGKPGLSLVARSRVGLDRGAGSLLLLPVTPWYVLNTGDAEPL